VISDGLNIFLYIVARPPYAIDKKRKKKKKKKTKKLSKVLGRKIPFSSRMQNTKPKRMRASTGYRILTRAIYAHAATLPGGSRATSSLHWTTATPSMFIPPRVPRHLLVGILPLLKTMSTTPMCSMSLTTTAIPIIVGRRRITILAGALAEISRAVVDAADCSVASALHLEEGGVGGRKTKKEKKKQKTNLYSSSFPTPHYRSPPPPI
jgi:hypothetical protein